MVAIGFDFVVLMVTIILALMRRAREESFGNGVKSFADSLAFLAPPHPPRSRPVLVMTVSEAQEGGERRTNACGQHNKSADGSGRAAIAGGREGRRWWRGKKQEFVFSNQRLG